MNAETTRAALLFMEQGEDFAWVTILDTRGSLPRHSGAAMVVRRDGGITGSIGGGAFEGSVIAIARDVIEQGGHRVVHYDAATLGMTCGGQGEVLIEQVAAGCPQRCELLRALLDLLQNGSKGWLVTALPEKGGGEEGVRRCLVGPDGSLSGDALCSPEALRLLAKRGGTYDRLLAELPARAYVQPVGARGKVYVFGAGHCGARLVPVLSMLGFFTVVIDDRVDFANAERFPTADRIVVPESFEGVVETLSIDQDSYLVIVTRGHSHDTDVLDQALRTEARYLGMIGSKSKVAEAFRVLGERGYSQDDLARVHAPIGLSIGAETPEEIAVSIAAQLVQVRTGSAAGARRG